MRGHRDAWCRAADGVTMMLQVQSLEILEIVHPKIAIGNRVVLTTMPRQQSNYGDPPRLKEAVPYDWYSRFDVSALLLTFSWRHPLVARTRSAEVTAAMAVEEKRLN